MLVLVFTGALWWIARRDLAARAAPPALPAPAEDTAAQMAELEQLCATLEALVTSLARRLNAVEKAAAERLSAERLSAEWPSAERPSLEPQAAERPHAEAASILPLRVAEPLPPASVPAEPLPDPRYAPVYALVRDGISDPVEIARLTGLGRGEVELILSLRDRRAI